MAFEQPLEADTVEDLGFVSTFLRAPVIGPLLWILGGDEARKQQQEEADEAMLTSCVSLDDDDDDAEEEEKMKCKSILLSPQKSSLQKSRRIASLQHEMDLKLRLNDPLNKKKPRAPRLIGSDLSDFGECAAALEEVAELEESRKQQQERLKRTKKSTSWSDESGKSLAVYMDMTTPMTFESTQSTMSSSSSSSKQIKSAMKRTDRWQKKPASDGLRYIPKGLTCSAHNGLIYPTRPVGPHPSATGASSSSAAGDMANPNSPGFGWYVNITPPTPEMYANHRSSTSNLGSKPPSGRHPTTTSRRSILKHQSTTHPPAWTSVPI